jgi:heptosyltransferase-1
MERSEILIIRLGALGDVVHALPAVASLRRSFPDKSIRWAVAPKWLPLLEGNPNVDGVLAFRRNSGADLLRSFHLFRSVRPDVAIDFQGLLQSALLGRLSRPRIFWGLHQSVTRERLAASLYTHKCLPTATHMVEKNIELAQAAGARSIVRDFFIPQGRAEGVLPRQPFILANPFAGWISKQWPLENYELLARKLTRVGMLLVANVPPGRELELQAMPSVLKHTSSLAGLIDATRRAAAVVGVDSGPIHLAAALGKPGVALYGPTDPARNGPYGGSIRVLRDPHAVTSYKRGAKVEESMRSITVDQVYENLMTSIETIRLGAR